MFQLFIHTFYRVFPDLISPLNIARIGGIGVFVKTLVNHSGHEKFSLWKIPIRWVFFAHTMPSGGGATG